MSHLLRHFENIIQILVELSQSTKISINSLLVSVLLRNMFQYNNKNKMFMINEQISMTNLFPRSLCRKNQACNSSVRSQQEPHLQTQLHAVPVSPSVYPSLICFSSFTFPGVPYPFFLLFLPWLSYNFWKHDVVSPISVFCSTIRRTTV